MGASVKPTSRTSRSTASRSALTAISDSTPAMTKAWLIVRPASWIEIGAPEAWGASERTARANRSRLALSLESPFGKTVTRT